MNYRLYVITLPTLFFSLFGQLFAMNNAMEIDGGKSTKNRIKTPFPRHAQKMDVDITSLTADQEMQEESDMQATIPLERLTISASSEVITAAVNEEVTGMLEQAHVPPVEPSPATVILFTAQLKRQRQQTRGNRNLLLQQLNTMSDSSDEDEMSAQETTAIGNFRSAKRMTMNTPASTFAAAVYYQQRCTDLYYIEQRWATRATAFKLSILNTAKHTTVLLQKPQPSITKFDIDALKKRGALQPKPLRPTLSTNPLLSIQKPTN